MRNHEPREETGRVFAVAAALWGTIVAAGALEGAFGRFEPASIAILAAFASLFAVASYFLDPQLREYAGRMDALRTGGLALAAAGAFVMAIALGSVPFAVWLAPLAALGSVVVATRLRPRARPRTSAMSASPAKSPGANPAAT